MSDACTRGRKSNTRIVVESYLALQLQFVRFSLLACEDGSLITKSCRHVQSAYWQLSQSLPNITCLLITRCNSVDLAAASFASSWRANVNFSMLRSVRDNFFRSPPSSWLSWTADILPCRFDCMGSKPGLVSRDPSRNSFPLLSEPVEILPDSVVAS